MKRMIFLLVLTSSVSTFANSVDVEVNFYLHIRSRLANGRSYLNGINKHSLNIQKNVINQLQKKGYNVVKWISDKRLEKEFQSQNFSIGSPSIAIDIRCKDQTIVIGGNGQVSTGLEFRQRSLAIIEIPANNILVKASKHFNYSNTSCGDAIDKAFLKF